MSLLNVTVKRAKYLAVGVEDVQAAQFNTYVTLKLQNVKSTTVTVKGPEPCWEQDFLFETNHGTSGLLVEVWTKGMIWDRAVGYQLIALDAIPYSSCDSPGQWYELDMEVIMRDGEVAGTRTPTGHMILLECRFEMPFDPDTQSGDLQRKLELLNDGLMMSTSNTGHSELLSTHHHLSADHRRRQAQYLGNSGYSEDSDYTSDLNFPVGQNANSSASQYRNLRTPQRSLETSRENSYEKESYYDYGGHHQTHAQYHGTSNGKHPAELTSTGARTGGKQTLIKPTMTYSSPTDDDEDYYKPTKTTYAKDTGDVDTLFYNSRPPSRTSTSTPFAEHTVPAPTRPATGGTAYHQRHLSSTRKRSLERQDTMYDDEPYFDDEDKQILMDGGPAIDATARSGHTNGGHGCSSSLYYYDDEGIDTVRHHMDDDPYYDDDTQRQWDAGGRGTSMMKILPRVPIRHSGSINEDLIYQQQQHHHQQPYQNGHSTKTPYVGSFGGGAVLLPATPMSAALLATTGPKKSRLLPQPLKPHPVPVHPRLLPSMPSPVHTPVRDIGTAHLRRSDTEYSDQDSIHSGYSSYRPGAVSAINNYNEDYNYAYESTDSLNQSYADAGRGRKGATLPMPPAAMMSKTSRLGSAAGGTGFQQLDLDNTRNQNNTFATGSYTQNQGLRNGQQSYQSAYPPAKSKPSFDDQYSYDDNYDVDDMDDEEANFYDDDGIGMGYHHKDDSPYDPRKAKRLPGQPSAFTVKQKLPAIPTPINAIVGHCVTHLDSPDFGELTADKLSPAVTSYSSNGYSSGYGSSSTCTATGLSIPTNTSATDTSPGFFSNIPSSNSFIRKFDQSPVTGPVAHPTTSAAQAPQQILSGGINTFTKTLSSIFASKTPATSTTTSSTTTTTRPGFMSSLISSSTHAHVPATTSSSFASRFMQPKTTVPATTTSATTPHHPQFPGQPPNNAYCKDEEYYTSIGGTGSGPNNANPPAINPTHMDYYSDDYKFNYDAYSRFSETDYIATGDITNEVRNHYNNNYPDYGCTAVEPLLIGDPDDDLAYTGGAGQPQHKHHQQQIDNISYSYCDSVTSILPPATSTMEPMKPGLGATTPSLVGTAVSTPTTTSLHHSGGVTGTSTSGVSAVPFYGYSTAATPATTSYFPSATSASAASAAASTSIPSMYTNGGQSTTIAHTTNTSASYGSTGPSAAPSATVPSKGAMLLKQQPTVIYDDDDEDVEYMQDDDIEYMEGMDKFDDQARLDSVFTHSSTAPGDYYASPGGVVTTAATAASTASVSQAPYYSYQEDYFNEEDEYKYLEEERGSSQTTGVTAATHQPYDEDADEYYAQQRLQNDPFAKRPSTNGYASYPSSSTTHAQDVLANDAILTATTTTSTKKKHLAAQDSIDDNEFFIKHSKNQLTINTTASSGHSAVIAQVIREEDELLSPSLSPDDFMSPTKTLSPIVAITTKPLPVVGPSAAAPSLLLATTTATTSSSIIGGITASTAAAAMAAATSTMNHIADIGGGASVADKTGDHTQTTDLDAIAAVSLLDTGGPVVGLTGISSVMSGIGIGGEKKIGLGMAIGEMGMTVAGTTGMVGRKSEITAKQRWNWAYNKIIMQLNMSNHPSDISYICHFCHGVLGDKQMSRT